MSRSSRTPRLSWFVVASCALLAACGREPSAPPAAQEKDLPTVRTIALAVDMTAGTVTQESGLSANAGRDGPRLALLGSNEVVATVTNIRRTPGKGKTTLLTFDLSLTNGLSSVDLVPSTFPAAPAAQVVAFPFETAPNSLFGNQVVPSADWDGSPWSFFNDRHCTPAPQSDCYRWEGFGNAVVAGSTTAARTVGFDVDHKVTTFTVYVAVAADLLDRGTGPSIALGEFDPVFKHAIGNDAPASRSVAITNDGSGLVTSLSTSITYTHGLPTGWLSASLSNATAPSTLTLTPAVGGLTPGIYRATVTLNSPVSASRSLSIILVVSDDALITSSEIVDLWFSQGDATGASQSVLITSSGSFPVSDLSVSTLGFQESPWLTKTLDRTTVPATLTLTPNTAGMLAGSYTAYFRVISPDARSVIIGVNLLVSSSPDLTFDITSAVVTPAAGTIRVTGLIVRNTSFVHDWEGYGVQLCLSSSSSLSDCVPGLMTGVSRPPMRPEYIDALPELVIPAPAGGLYHVLASVVPSGPESDRTNNMVDLGAFTIPPASRQQRSP